MVKLGEVIKPAPVRKAGDQVFPILSMTMHDGLVDQESKFKKRVASADLSQYKVIRRDQLVVGFPIDEGVLAFQDLYDEAVVSPAYGVWDVKSPDKVDPRYLQKFLRSPLALSYYRARLQGTTARRRSLPSAVFLDLDVLLPSIREQRRIAAILDHADALRAKRREVLARLDELTQSIFIDMFGDPVANDREWPSRYVGDFVAGFDSGRNLVGAAEDVDAHRVLKVSAVTSLAYRESESKPLPAGYEPPVNHLVRRGDLLFSRANTAELVGATAFVSDTDGRTALPDKLWRFRWHDDSPVAPRFVEKLFQRPEFRKTLSDRATGSSGSMKNISRMSVLSIAVGLPPLKLQRKFEKSVERVESVRSRHLVALDELDALFASLQARAFRGEL